MDIEQFLPDRPGYAEFGYQRPQWEDPIYKKSPHTKSNVKTYTQFSSATASYSGTTVTGGQNWTKVTFATRSLVDGTITSGVDIISLNQLFGPAQGGTTFEEYVGLGYNRNPDGMQEWAITKQAVRVRRTRLYIQCENYGTASSVDFMFIPERSDATFVSGMAVTAADKNTDVTQSARIPGAITWTTSINNTKSTDANVASTSFKKLQFDIPQYFHDKEWHLDAPNATTPNFWVVKDGNSLFTGPPTFVLRGHLYARMNTPDHDNSTAMFIKALFSWDVELHTGNNIYPPPNQVNDVF